MNRLALLLLLGGCVGTVSELAEVPTTAQVDTGPAQVEPVHAGHTEPDAGTEVRIIEKSEETCLPASF